MTRPAKKSAAKKAAPVRTAGATRSPAVPPAPSTVPDSAVGSPAAESPGPRPIWDGGGETRQQYYARVQAWNEARREARS